MKYLGIFLFCIGALFADSFTLENKTPFNKIAIQWAPSARAAQEMNDALIQREPLSASELYRTKQSKTIVRIPKNAAYFRVLVWETSDKLPDRLTNWIELVPGKTYLLKKEHLVPLLLINGMGC